MVGPRALPTRPRHRRRKRLSTHLAAHYGQSRGPRTHVGAAACSSLREEHPSSLRSFALRSVDIEFGLSRRFPCPTTRKRLRTYAEVPPNPLHDRALRPHGENAPLGGARRVPTCFDAEGARNGG